MKGAGAERSQDRRWGSYAEAHSGDHRNLLNHMSLEKAKPGGSSLAFVCDLDRSW